MTISDTIVGRDLETLRAAVAGGVFAAGDAGYDQARQAWNLAVDERPAVVVMAESAADVAQAGRFADTHGAPRITRTPLCPARAASSSRLSAARSA